MSDMGKPLFRWPREGGFLRPRAGRPAGGCQGSLAAFAPCPVGQGARRAGGGPLPVKGDSFRIERIPLDNPEEKFWEGFRFPSQTLLETTKGRAAALPLETIPGGGQGSGVYGGRWDGGRESGARCLRRFRAFCLVGDEVGEGLVVLAPTLGGWGPAGDGGGTPGRRALRVVEESLINHPGTGSRRRSRLAARRMVGATGRRRQ